MLLLLSWAAIAHPSYLDLIPNGRLVYHQHSVWHAVGHTHAWMHNVTYAPTMLSARFALSGFNRNDFGRDFARLGRRWSDALCRADSDGDGMSNGMELGDPECVWSVGMQPSRTAPVSHPGYHASHLEVTWESEKPSHGGPRYTNPVVRWATAWGNEEKWAGCPDVTPTVPLYVYLHPGWVAVALALRWRYPGLPTPRPLTMFVLWFLVAVVGVGLAEHRYFSHKVFETGVVFKNVLAFIGNLAEGNPARWAQMHRIHHRVCDEEMDYHSPVPRGFFFAHWTWMCEGHPMIRNTWARARLTHDIDEDPEILPILLHANGPKWGLVASVPLFVAYYLWSEWRRRRRRAGGYGGEGEGFEKEGSEALLEAEGGSSRRRTLPPGGCFVVALCRGFVASAWYWVLPSYCAINATNLVNSATHLWGRQPFADGNGRHQCTARNTWWLQLILWGENWHNNHHASPGSASTWVVWHQVDVVYMIIRSLELCGVVWNVKVSYPVPPPSQAAEYREEGAYWMAFHGALLLLAAGLLARRYQRRHDVHAEYRRVPVHAVA